MTQQPDPYALRDFAVRLARAAGELVGNRPDDLQIRTKSTPTDPVTVMDRASESLIVRLIDENRPGDGILGEEGTARPGTTGVRWIVDPIDGTVNYTYGIRAYAVSIAAEVDGTVVAGAVFDAQTATVHEAVRGGGARSEGVALHCRTIDDLAVGLVATGFAYAAADRARQGAVVARLLPRIRDIRRIGSAALDLCGVGLGLVDAYYETGLNDWDLAAGKLIAGESGARVETVADGPRRMTVAAAPGIFDALLAALRAA